MSGRPVADEAKGLMVRFTGDEQVALHERLRRRAFDEDRPMAELVREALERFLDPGFVASYAEPAPKGPQRRAESRSSGPGPEPRPDPDDVNACTECGLPTDPEEMVCPSCDQRLRAADVTKDERLAKARAAQEALVEQTAHDATLAELDKVACPHPKDRQKALGMKRICLDCHEEVSR